MITDSTTFTVDAEEHRVVRAFLPSHPSPRWCAAQPRVFPRPLSVNTENDREVANGDGTNTVCAAHDAGSSSSNGFTLTEVLSKLTVRDAKEVETRTRRHRDFLTEGVVPQVAAGLVAAAEARAANIFEFLADHLVRSVCARAFPFQCFFPHGVH